MITIIQVLLIVLLYSVYHVLSYSVDCPNMQSCIVSCASSSPPGRVNITLANFIGSHTNGGSTQICQSTVTTQVRALCGIAQNQVATFQVTTTTMGGDPCNGQATDLQVYINFDCIKGYQDTINCARKLDANGRTLTEDGCDGNENENEIQFPTTEPTSPPPPPCTSGQDYPSCQSCGNISFINYLINR